MKSSLSLNFGSAIHLHRLDLFEILISWLWPWWSESNLSVTTSSYTIRNGWANFTFFKSDCFLSHLLSKGTLSMFSFCTLFQFSWILSFTSILGFRLFYSRGSEIISSLSIIGLCEILKLCWFGRLKDVS